MKSTLEVTDLFKGAFLMCMGGRLAKVQIRNHAKRDRQSRKLATFLITGADLDRFDHDYRCGRALVNPLQLRESLNHLRDVMFEKLRKHDQGSSRQGRDYAGVEGRMRYDRKEKDRSHQAWR